MSKTSKSTPWVLFILVTCGCNVIRHFPSFGLSWMCRPICHKLLLSSFLRYCHPCSCSFQGLRASLLKATWCELPPASTSISSSSMCSSESLFLGLSSHHSLVSRSFSAQEIFLSALLCRYLETRSLPFAAYFYYICLPYSECHLRFLASLMVYSYYHSLIVIFKIDLVQIVKTCRSGQTLSDERAVGLHERKLSERSDLQSLAALPYELEKWKIESELLPFFVCQDALLFLWLMCNILLQVLCWLWPRDITLSTIGLFTIWRKGSFARQKMRWRRHGLQELSRMKPCSQMTCWYWPSPWPTPSLPLLYSSLASSTLPSAILFSVIRLVLESLLLSSWVWLSSSLPNQWE